MMLDTKSSWKWKDLRTEGTIYSTQITKMPDYLLESPQYVFNTIREGINKQYTTRKISELISERHQYYISPPQISLIKRFYFLKKYRVLTIDCFWCGSNNVVGGGNTYSKSKGTKKQRFICTDCGKTFYGDCKIFLKKNKNLIKNFCRTLKRKGYSTRETTNKIDDVFGFSITHTTVQEYLKEGGGNVVSPVQKRSFGKEGVKK